jgi:Tfp pilus assembly protein PilV
MMELLVTMLLLTIVLTGLAALQVAAVRNVGGSRRSAEAMRLAQSTLERYKSMSIADVTAHSQGDWMPEYDRNGLLMSSVSADGVGKGPYTVQVMTETLASGAILVSAKVTWMDVSSKRDGAGNYLYEEFNVVLSTLRL